MPELEVCPRCNSKLPPRFATGRIICSRCGWTDKPRNAPVPDELDVNEKTLPEANHSANLPPQTSVTPIAFKVKRGAQEVEVPDIETLRQYVIEGHIKLSDYVYNPILSKWMYAQELAELEDIVNKQQSTAKSMQYNKMSWTFAGFGLLVLFVFPPAGIVLMIIGVILSVMYYVNKGS
jgi:hypothetical protein